MKHFTEEQKQYARKADLYAYLMKYHASYFRKEGVSIHPINNKSLSIKQGYSGYLDFATGEKGNSIDYLVRHMDYPIDEAVLALCGDTVFEEPEKKSASEVGTKGNSLPPNFPQPIQGKYKNLYAYLTNRGISAKTIQMLIDRGIIYQESGHNNIVFANQERDWGELRGTYTKGKSFHGIIPNSRKNGFWWFQVGAADRVYICEAAIDAISLYEILQKENAADNAVYVSIGGVQKQPAIDRLKQHKHCIMAVDNDDAGRACRNRNPELEAIIPKSKDWNEDLLNFKY